MLRPPLLAPTPTYLVRMIVAAAGCALVGTAAMVSAQPPVVQEPAAPLAIVETVTVPMSAPMVVSQEPPPVAKSLQIALTFRVGGALYMKLATKKLPRHGKVTISEDDFVVSAIATVDPANVPRAEQHWLGKRVIVDGTCTANITGFAVVGRLTGDPGYAGIENEEHWDPTTAMDEGEKFLAARLDNCAGGTYARDASLPTVVIPREVDDAGAIAAATKQLYATAEVKAAQKEWDEYQAQGTKGIWYEDPYLTRETTVVRHPRTGETWVSVHLFYGGGCGSPNINVWGLFRKTADGTLVQTRASLGELISIEKLIDIDDDGELEVIGRPWLGMERAVQRRNGSMIDSLALPFYGCPC
ncbi:hypothetical protein BH11MYX3_BH11MYX3_06700 [soil metagenome]